MTASPYPLPKFYIVNAVDGIPFARDLGRGSTDGKKDGKFPSSHSFAFCFNSLHFVLSRFLSHHFISLHFVLFWFAPFRLISFRFPSFHFTLFCLVTYCFISLHFVLFCSVLFLFATSTLSCLEHSLCSQGSLFFILLESALSPSLTLSLLFPICFVFFFLAFVGKIWSAL